MVGEMIKEYLVGLGVKIDKPGFAEFDSTINEISNTISAATGGWAKNFVTASGIIVTAMASVTASVVGLMTAAAQQDLAMEKYARNMLISKDAAIEMKGALDALGESVRDIQLTPELMGRYRALVADGRNMKIGGDYGETMQDFRDLIFEFTRLKQEASYAMQWVGYYLMKHLEEPLDKAKKTFKSLNDSIIKNMPVWTEKVARALVYVVNIGRHFWDLLKAIGKTIADVWDAFPRGVKIATAALAAFFVLLRASPLSRMIALIGSLLILIDDYFGYMEGKQAAMGGVWDKLNGYIDAGKRKLTEWGRELAPVWDSFVGYLVMAKDGMIELSGKISDWIDEVQNSQGLRDFVDTMKRLGKALWILGDGIIDFVTDSCKSLMKSFEKQDSAKTFTDLMQRLWDIFLGLIDTVSYCCEVIGGWLKEMGQSEVVRDFIDAVVELFDAIMELIGAFLELCRSALGEFFEGMNKTEQIYSFKDAIKAVVGFINDMIRALSSVIRWISKLFKSTSEDKEFKEYWQKQGKMIKGFTDLIFDALGAVGKLGQALMALVRGDYKIAAKLAKEAIFGDSKAEAGGKYDFSGDEPTGILSTRHEGDVGTVSSGEGDPYGGVSYGAFQFSSKMGIADDFVDWLKGNGHRFGEQLSDAGAVNSESFKDAWRAIAVSNREEFFKLQQDFARKEYYVNTADNILDSTGFDVTKMSRAMKEVVWSTGVHHGAGGATSIFKAALRNAGDNASEEELFKQIYEQRYLQSDAKVRDSFIPRFNTELEEALEMYRQERENKAKEVEQKNEPKEENGKYQFLNKNGEPPQYEFRNPPTDMHDPTWWNYAKETIGQVGKGVIDAGGWLWDKAGELGGAILGTSTDSNVNLSAHLQNTAAGVDPVMLNRLMGGAASTYSQSYGGTDIKNISYQIKVGDVIVSKTDASPTEIGQAVADRAISSLEERGLYFQQSRLLGG